MTAADRVYEGESRRFPFILVVLVALVTLAIMFFPRPGDNYIMPAGKVQSMLFRVQVDIRPTLHALAKHGAQVTAIHKCLNKNGAAEIWEFTSFRFPNHYIQLCNMDDGNWGIRIVQLTKIGKWRERTSFIVKEGTYRQVVEYVSARAVRIFTNLVEIAGA